MYFDTKNKHLAKNRWAAEVSVRPKNVVMTFSRVYSAVRSANDSDNSELIAKLLNKANDQGFNGLNQAAKRFKPTVTLYPDRIVISFNVQQSGIDQKTDEVRKFATIQKMKSQTDQDAHEKRTTMERFLSVLIKKRMPWYMYKVLKRNSKTLPLRVTKVAVMRKYVGTKYVNKRQSLNLYVFGNKKKRFATLTLATYSKNEVDTRSENLEKLLKPEWIVGDV